MKLASSRDDAIDLLPMVAQNTDKTVGIARRARMGSDIQEIWEEMYNAVTDAGNKHAMKFSGLFPGSIEQMLNRAEVVYKTLQSNPGLDWNQDNFGAWMDTFLSDVNMKDFHTMV
jgi:hypothetical protein